jgi:hypothetical protein
LIERSIALRKAAQDRQALEVLQRAEQLDAQSTRVQVHLAAVYQALGEWEAADQHLTRALRDPTDSYVEKHQSTLAAARRSIDAHMCSLRISGGPAGTQIRLNGRPMGALPLDRTLRVEAGIYTLEAQQPGYYPVIRSVALGGGALVQEAVNLAPVSEQVGTFVPQDRAPAPAMGRANWLTWTFAGLGVGAAGGTVAAWAMRQHHADRWNDDGRCLKAGQTRAQTCGSEREAGKAAETWMWVGAAATGGFAAAAVASYFLNEKSPAPAAKAALSCGVGFAALSCAGRF